MESTVIREDQIVPPISSFERIKGTEALTVPEILRAILDHATPPTLAWAAQVSKAWSAVALDKLWSDFDIKVIDLLRVFPLESTQSSASSSTYWELQRDPSDEEWTRFQSYASRVRSLSMPPDPPDHGFHPSITEWKADNDVVFPRLRRVEWPLSSRFSMPTSQLSSFTTSGLQELSLTRPNRGSRMTSLREVTMSTLHELTTIKGLRLKKFKFESPSMDSKLGDVISNFVTAQGDSLQALELLTPCNLLSPLVSHSLRNLTALDIHIRLIDGAEGSNTMQALVEACPRVSYLRLEITQGDFDLGSPSLRATLGWRLLSFDVRSAQQSHIIKAHIAMMANAWPKLKQLGFDVTYADNISFLLDFLDPHSRRIPLSCLGEIIVAFPELEQLSMAFYCDLDEAHPPPVPRSSSPLHCPSRLRKLRLNPFSSPKSEKEREIIARFMAAVCPAGLRVERVSIKSSIPRPAVPAVAMEGRDLDPEWDALFQKIEELHGGVKIWVGSIPEEDDGLWF